MRIDETITPLELLHGDGKLYTIVGAFICDTKYTLYGTIRVKTTRTDVGSEEIEKNRWREGTIAPNNCGKLHYGEKVSLMLKDGRRIDLVVTDSHRVSVRAEPAPF